MDGLGQGQGQGQRVGERKRKERVTRQSICLNKRKWVLFSVWGVARGCKKKVGKRKGTKGKKNNPKEVQCSVILSSSVAHSCSCQPLLSDMLMGLSGISRNVCI